MRPAWHAGKDERQDDLAEGLAGSCAEVGGVLTFIMKVELHLHTSRYSGCSIVTPEEAMSRLIEFGYDAVYITEHDTVWPDDELHRLREKFPEIRIFPGVELSLGDQHLLVLGTSDREYLRIGCDADVLARAREAGHLTVLAHPFRWAGGAAMLESSRLPDAIEHLTGNHTPRDAGISAQTADNLGLPIVNSGDIHTADMMNRFWIETAEAVEDACDIRRIVMGGAYKNCCG